MPNLIARIGDSCDHGGEIVTGSINTIVEGSGAARDGDFLNCAVHGIVGITGTGKAIINGRNVVINGDIASCGATIIAGSVKSYS
jgi:uncharacterized Zn-binding protein involved in type VI secretion